MFDKPTILWTWDKITEVSLVKISWILSNHLAQCSLKVSWFWNVLFVSSNRPKHQQSFGKDFFSSHLKEVESKKYGHFIPLIWWFYFDSLTLLFLIWPLFWAEILTKIWLFFWSIWRHQKDISKSTDLWYNWFQGCLRTLHYC